MNKKKSSKAKKSKSPNKSAPTVHKIKAKVKAADKTRTLDKNNITASDKKTDQPVKQTDINSTKITKISATKPAGPKKSKKSFAIFKIFKPLVMFGQYLKNSRLELKQVHWPSRKNTWEMVFSVIVYSALFLVVVLCFDVLFSWLFKLMIGS